jgi:hypothetical protein
MILYHEQNEEEDSNPTGRIIRGFNTINSKRPAIIHDSEPIPPTLYPHNLFSEGLSYFVFQLPLSSKQTHSKKLPQQNIVWLLSPPPTPPSTQA